MSLESFSLLTRMNRVRKTDTRVLFFFFLPSLSQIPCLPSLPPSPPLLPLLLHRPRQPLLMPPSESPHIVSLHFIPHCSTFPSLSKAQPPPPNPPNRTGPVWNRTGPLSPPNPTGTDSLPAKMMPEASSLNFYI